MTSASMSFGRPVRVTFPRGALWFGNLAAFLIQSLTRRAAAGNTAPTRQPAAQAAATADDHSDALPPRCRVWFTLEKE